MWWAMNSQAIATASFSKVFTASSLHAENLLERVYDLDEV